MEKIPQYERKKQQKRRQYPREDLTSKNIFKSCLKNIQMKGLEDRRHVFAIYNFLFWAVSEAESEQ